MGSCCTANCPADGSRGGMSDGCGKTCGCPSGAVLYGGSCCTPGCPADGSKAGMSDGCGKTCGCPSGAVLYGGSCCTPACPKDGSNAGKSDGCGGMCTCPMGSMMYMGSCCTPSCPADGSKAGMSDGCGKTCGCASGDVLYGGSCCTPSCAKDGSSAGKSNGCGGTCTCPMGSMAYMGSCCTASCPADGSKAGMSDGCGKTCGCASGSVLYGGNCCTPSCPKDGTCGAADGCGGDVRLHRRRDVLGRQVPHQDLQSRLRLRPDLQQRRLHSDPVRRGGPLRLQLLLLLHRAVVRCARRRPLMARRRHRSRSDRGRAGLACTFSPSNGGAARASSSTSPSSTVVPPCTGICADFPTAPIVTGGAPAGAPSMFAGSGNAPAPCLTEPEDGALFPDNWLRPRVKVSAPGATLFEFRFRSPMQANDLVVYTASDNWAMDETTWLALATHVVDSPITVTARTLGPSGLSAASTASFTIAPVGASGQMVYWALRGFDASNTDNEELFGFSVGDASVTSVLKVAQVQENASGVSIGCIGCHTATPDGSYVGFTGNYPWPNALASVEPTSVGAMPSFLGADAQNTLTTYWHGIITFSGGALDRRRSHRDHHAEHAGGRSAARACSGWSSARGPPASHRPPGRSERRLRAELQPRRDADRLHLDQRQPGRAPRRRNRGPLHRSLRRRRRRPRHADPGRRRGGRRRVLPVVLARRRAGRVQPTAPEQRAA